MEKDVDFEAWRLNGIDELNLRTRWYTHWEMFFTWKQVRMFTNVHDISRFTTSLCRFGISAMNCIEHFSSHHRYSWCFCGYH